MTECRLVFESPEVIGLDNVSPLAMEFARRVQELIEAAVFPHPPQPPTTLHWPPQPKPSGPICGIVTDGY